MKELPCGPGLKGAKGSVILETMLDQVEEMI